MSIRERLSKETAIKIAYGWDGTVRDKWNDIEVLADLIATALNDQAAEYDEVLEDKKRLVRELDVAMHGEEGAAKQASLCDLITMAEQKRLELENLRSGYASLRDAIVKECILTVTWERQFFDKSGKLAASRILNRLAALMTSAGGMASDVDKTESSMNRDTLLEALKPFATEADTWGDHVGDSEPYYICEGCEPPRFTIGDLRRARDLMREMETTPVDKTEETP